MQTISILCVFRIFSANEWNQRESFIQISLSIPTFQNEPILFSNAEKLRKMGCHHIEYIILASSRTRWNNGLYILFPSIQDCFNLFSWIR